ncbi:MAG: GYD domain-containing protein [Candidatus Hodarchaeota archaeon]
MAIFILVTKVSADLTQDLSERKALGEKWLKEIKAKCPEVKFLHHWALLGPYDFLDVFEAPDHETAIKVSLLTRSAGATVAETWTATAYARFLELIEEVS